MSFDHDKTEHDRNVTERRRYRIVRLPGEVDKIRKSVADTRTHNGDLVHEYYDDVLIREHKLTIQMLESYAYGRPGVLEETPVFETRWCIDDASQAKLPSVIVNGRWSDPAAVFLAKKGLHPTQPLGEWGVYGPSFTDAYTLGQIQPLEDRYNHLRTSMLSASNGLYVPEKYVNTVGLFDNLEFFVKDWQSKIAECNTKILQAQSILVSTGGASYIAGSPQQEASTVHAKLSLLGKIACP